MQFQTDEVESYLKRGIRLGEARWPTVSGGPIALQSGNEQSLGLANHLIQQLLAEPYKAPEKGFRVLVCRCF